MYQFGEGIKYDYYMARRHYGLALERMATAEYPTHAMLWLLDYPDTVYWLTTFLCITATSMLLIFKGLS
jgi:hypothetical protein